MSVRFRTQDRNNLEAFQVILQTAGTYLPLDIMIRLFSQMKKNKEGYDHMWLKNAILVTKELCELHTLSEGSKSVMYAVTFLMETGRSFDQEHPHDASAAFAMVFLGEHGDNFFTDEEIRAIVTCCKRQPYNTMRPTVDTQLGIIASEVRLMTDVVYPNVPKLIVEFVKENVAPTVTPISIDQWCAELSELFAMKYGNGGSIWKTMPSMTLHYWPEKVKQFQNVADNSRIIIDQVKSNYSRIFGKG
jgi:hypothetical protein